MGWVRSFMGRVTLKTKFVVLLAAIIVACLCLNLAWSVQGGEEQTERELLQQARALSANMDAAWNFMTINQDLINYDSEGNYEFKGLQCSIAGRSIGSLFSQETDYVTHYVSPTPRNESDEPDSFEAVALGAFANDPNRAEYYAVADGENGQVFRYLAPMVMEESCLDCHGSPKGEIDESGYPKEGLEVGDLYGAISLIIPMETYEAAAWENTARNVVFSIVLIAACIGVIYIALTTLVTKPLGRFRTAVAGVEAGDLSVRLASEASSLEVSDLSRGFNRMADKLETLYTGLEEQVSERTEALEKANRVLELQRKDLESMNEKLLDENRYKSDFLAMMSHELRTPLAASMAFTELLEERSRPQSEEERQLWGEIDANNKTLLSLINNILEMARIDAGKETLHLALFDIGDIAGMMQGTVESLANQKGIAVRYRISNAVPLFMVDAEKLRRIVENLMSNAVKFTPEGGTVTVSGDFDASNKRVVIVVSDTGIGIPPEEQGAVFERFVQVDSSPSRSYGGSGLGLALVKELVEMHGGTIRLESEPGCGSAFTVSLPSDLADAG